MAVEKIGRHGFGGAGISEGHQRGGESSAKKLFLALRKELDQLYLKLNQGSLPEDDFGKDTVTPHQKQFKA